MITEPATNPGSGRCSFTYRANQRPPNSGGQIAVRTGVWPRLGVSFRGTGDDGVSKRAEATQVPGGQSFCTTSDSSLTVLGFMPVEGCGHAKVRAWT